VFRIVGAEIANPAVGSQFLDLSEGLLYTALVDAGLDVEMEEIVAEPRAARAGFHAGEVDITISKRLQ